MAGGLVERCRESQDLFRRQGPRGHDGRHRGLPCGERPRLVEQHRGAPGKAFEYSAVLHHDPAARRRRQAGDQGDRRREDERARRGDDQDGHRPFGAAQRPRRCGHGQGQRQEPHGVPVGEPDERRLRAFRLADQADDPRIGAVRRAAAGPQVERPGRVEGAAAQRVALDVLDGQGLTGERGFIEYGGARGQHAVHRDDVAGRDEQQVTGRDLIQRHGLERSVPVAPPGPRRPLQQGAQVLPGAVGRPGLQGASAGQHDADHRRGQQFVHRYRAGQREQRDHVHADPAVSDAGDRDPEGVAEPARRRGQPRGVGGPAGSRQPGRPARDHPGCRHGEQQRRGPADQPRPHAPGHGDGHGPSLGSRTTRAQGGKAPDPGPLGPLPPAGTKVPDPRARRRSRNAAGEDHRLTAWGLKAVTLPSGASHTPRGMDLSSGGAGHELREGRS